jgi:hypothetical protein
MGMIKEDWNIQTDNVCVRCKKTFKGHIMAALCGNCYDKEVQATVKFQKEKKNEK